MLVLPTTINCSLETYLCFDPKTGVFVPPPNPAPSASAIDLEDRIVAPGFLDLQINGAYGFDFSEGSASDHTGLSYTERYRDVRRKLITTGTTSFLPTMTKPTILGPFRVPSPLVLIAKDLSSRIIEWVSIYPLLSMRLEQQVTQSVSWMPMEK
ncbi:uncharacterized protein N7473_009679 [Penicillium subrubescens]|uniref:N-acetylglucosamine-6-phosphate deacetylase n=1 Tax=Penicillium subrubescens TaxID=1316194 RepID=A0A1Q5THE6_9EURO|nr:uncharacterized protein N7473_009679 [Penicillium subrubescens]KAJ5887005.1 hypothetical protein N7473_009679 [Penicillium subrubescens]OKO99639.1 hypothetical protein PENSUB_8292 [Penicillium subrubescens]